MDQPRLVKKKLVTVRCNNPFSYRKIPFAGVCNRVVLEVEAINYALMNKALVTEHLKGNKDIALGFDNYNTYNGPTLINDDSEVFKFSEPEIEMIDGLGNRTVVNKQRHTTAAVAGTIKHIDLEAQKRKEAEEEKKRKELEIQKQKQEELERKEALIKEQKERDKKAREEAAAKILADAQAKANQAVGIDKDSKDEFSYDFPASVSTEPKVDFINSNQQESKKVNYDGGKKDKRK